MTSQLPASGGSEPVVLGSPAQLRDGPFRFDPALVLEAMERGFIAKTEMDIDTKYGPMSTTLIDRGGFVRLWDSQAQAPYLWNKHTRTFISYEDPESLRLKSAYIREKGLGGAMFWEYYADKTGVLLDALFTTVQGQASATPRTRVTSRTVR